MANQVRSIPLDKLVPHPANPNRMSKANFAKLVRNIERTGRYEPLIVRPCRTVARDPSLVARSNERTSRNDKQRTMNNEQHFQIINGHHRWMALKKLGKKEANVIIWDIDDGDTDILLATLNRLCGQDVLDKRLALLKRLGERMQTAELAKLLPQTKKQIEKLNSTLDSRNLILGGNRDSKIFLTPIVFFVNKEQQQVIEAALDYANSSCNTKQTKAERRATALSAVCQYYLDHS
jgi:hypothetical protein